MSDVIDDTFDPDRSPAPASYLNPVFAGDFPDPYILKHGNAYWAYGTGFWHDGRCFGVLYSRDLVHWGQRAGAMEPLPGGHTCYWAPEVSYLDGRFYLYYSVGDEKRMQIRVAVADHPGGPFVDSGHRVSTEHFAIDPHVVLDEARNRYLFYATDFLEHSHIGTGTVRARMRDPFTLAEAPVPVTRAKYDWQVYDPRRAEKGGVRWHTVEGPFVLRHGALYYQMFSGGNWQNPSYGVSYAVSPHLDDPQEWSQSADGEATLPLLRTDRAAGIIGPGHNSVVRGPDNRQLYCVYHRWSGDGSARQMAIDPLDWAGERLVLSGPSATARPAPISPSSAGFNSEHWLFTEGAWEIDDARAVWRGEGTESAAVCTSGSPYFLMEFRYEGTELTVSLETENSIPLRLHFEPAITHATLSAGLHGGTLRLPLPPDYDTSAAHRLRIDVNGRYALLELDGLPLWSGWLEHIPARVRVAGAGRLTLFDPALTVGWEDTWPEGGEPHSLGWQALPEDSSRAWTVSDGALRHLAGETSSTLVKGEPLPACEWTIALKISSAGVGAGVTLAPAWRPGDPGPSLRIWRTAEGWSAGWEEAAEIPSFELPDGFDMEQPQLFRFRKEAERLWAQWEGHLLADLPVPATPTRIAVTADSDLAIDTLRLTAIPLP